MTKQKTEHEDTAQRCSKYSSSKKKEYGDLKNIFHSSEERWKTMIKIPTYQTRIERFFVESNCVLFFFCLFQLCWCLYSIFLCYLKRAARRLMTTSQTSSISSRPRKRSEKFERFAVLYSRTRRLRSTSVQEFSGRKRNVIAQKYTGSRLQRVKGCKSNCSLWVGARCNFLTLQSMTSRKERP